MMNEEDELKDWEIQREEDPPEELKRKWIVDEMKERVSLTCQACQQPVPPDAVSCHFCGASIHRTDVGFLSKMACWVKKLFGGKR